jgi:uncharacterized protein (DUF2147 family)
MCCFFLILLLSLSHGFPQIIQNATDNIVGVYWSPHKDAKVRISLKQGLYYGKSIWVATARKDIQNPDQSLRARVVLGIELFSHFSYSNGAYTDGVVYDAGSGKTYSCKMTLKEDKLSVRGYIGISLFGRTEIFERIK